MLDESLRCIAHDRTRIVEACLPDLAQIRLRCQRFWTWCAQAYGRWQIAPVRDPPFRELSYEIIKQWLRNTALCVVIVLPAFDRLFEGLVRCFVWFADLVNVGPVEKCPERLFHRLAQDDDGVTAHSL